MTREESWQVEGSTLALLRHIASLGYIVSVHRLGASMLGRPSSIEMHAVDVRKDPPQVHVASIGNDESGDVNNGARASWREWLESRLHLPGPRQRGILSAACARMTAAGFGRGGIVFAGWIVTR
jgi:hypothetical protein